MSMRLLLGFAYIPRLPLRMRPGITEGRGADRPGRDCRDDKDCCRGTSSSVLEFVELLTMLLVLDIELRVGVCDDVLRDGRERSPPRIKDFD